jgi:hypothetical protein
MPKDNTFWTERLPVLTSAGAVIGMVELKLESFHI